METEEQGLSKQRDTLIELQDWQEKVLQWMDSDELEEYSFRVGEAIPLKKKQKEMLEWALSDEYFILRASDREVLKRVFKRGFYYEEDKVVLNWIRENILKGKNFIK